MLISPTNLNFRGKLELSEDALNKIGRKFKTGDEALEILGVFSDINNIMNTNTPDGDILEIKAYEGDNFLFFDYKTADGKKEKLPWDFSVHFLKTATNDFIEKVKELVKANMTSPKNITTILKERFTDENGKIFITQEAFKLIQKHSYSENSASKQIPIEVLNALTHFEDFMNLRTHEDSKLTLSLKDDSEDLEFKQTTAQGKTRSLAYFFDPKTFLNKAKETYEKNINSIESKRIGAQIVLEAIYNKYVLKNN